MDTSFADILDVQSIIISILLFGSESTHAVSLYDQFAEKIATTLTSTDCAKDQRADKDCQANTSSQGLLSGVSPAVTDAVFLDKMVGYEIDDLECRETKWKSIKDQPEVAQKLVDEFNRVIPKLSEQKKLINKMISDNQILYGKLPKNQYSGVTESPKDRANRELYEENNEEIKRLMGLFQLQMSSLPDSENPLVRDFIDSHLEGIFSGVKPVTTEEFVKLNREMSNDLIDQKSSLRGAANEGGISSSDRRRISTSPEHLARLKGEFPESESSIGRFACQARMQTKGREVIVDTALTFSMVLPVGGAALALGSRAALAIRLPQIAVRMGQWGQVVSGAGIAVGFVQMAAQIVHSCTAEKKFKFEGTCELSKTRIENESALQDCIINSVLSALPLGASFLAKKMADQSSGLAKFVNLMVGERKSKDYVVASRLTDGERITAAENVIGRSLTVNERQALLEAHKIGKGYGMYTDEEITRKGLKLRRAGFTKEETKLLMDKGIAGQMPKPPPIWQLSPKEQARVLEGAGKGMTPEAVNLRRKAFVEARDEFDIDAKKIASREKIIPGESQKWVVLEDEAAYYGAYAGTPAEKLYATEQVIKAFKARLPALMKGGTSYSTSLGRTREDAIREYISILEKSGGSGSYKMADEFKIRALKDYLNNMEAWDRGAVKIVRPANLETAANEIVKPAGTSTSASPSAKPAPTSGNSPSARPTSPSSPAKGAVSETAPSTQANRPPSATAAPAPSAPVSEIGQARNVAKRPQEWDTDYERRLRTAQSFESWSGRQISQAQSEVLARRGADEMVNGGLRTMDDLSNAGFSLYERNMMRIAKFKLDDQAAKPLQDLRAHPQFKKLVEMDSSNPLLKGPVSDSVDEARKTIKAYREAIRRGRGTDSEIISERVNELVEHQKQLAAKMFEATTPEDANKVAAYMKKNGIECQNLYKLATLLNINTIKSNPQTGLQRSYEINCLKNVP